MSPEAKKSPWAVVSLQYVVKAQNGQEKIAETVTVGASASVCDFTLPDGMDNGVGWWEDSGDLYAQLLLRVTQRLCGLVSPPAETGLSAVLTAAQVPNIQQPIECSRQVTVSVVPGSTVTVFSDAPDYPQLSDRVKAYISPVTIGLYRPLRRTETIRVTASGCGGFTDAKSAVANMPFLDQVVIRTPVRLPHGGAMLENVVPGARIHIFVNDRYRTSIDAGDTEVFVTVPGL